MRLDKNRRFGQVLPHDAAVAAAFGGLRMPVSLKCALQEILAGWPEDLPAEWRDLCGDVQLGFEDVDPSLELEFWEPVFPARRGKTFPGMPAGAHMLRAFDGIAPERVRCVILGQDPYPSPEFATGRAFEAGNVASWRELDKMFSRSVRAFIQQIVAARSGEPRYARSFADWPRTLAAIETGAVAFEPASLLAQRWVDDGVLLLNASLTLSRFRVDGDPHQARGHWPLWRPLMIEALRALVSGKAPLVFIGFGDVAAATLRASGVVEGERANYACILRDHPAHADDVLALENPFLSCNRRLEAMGAEPIAW
jgi:uracil-DNA glycosylase